MRFECAAGALCLDFANTIHNSRAEDNGEELLQISDLLQFAKEGGLLSSGEHGRLAAHYTREPEDAAAVLATGIATRDLMLAIFSSVAAGLSHAPGRLRVHRHAARIEMRWESAASGLQQVLFAVLTSAAQLLASDRVKRVRECASSECTWLFVDESRNRSRRWCDMRVCGNRMKARRHYKRSRAADRRGA
jgi:predicted RNA-binding Zn ribbon-like protein